MYLSKVFFQKVFNDKLYAYFRNMTRWQLKLIWSNVLNHNFKDKIFLFYFREYTILNGHA